MLKKCGNCGGHEFTSAEAKIAGRKGELKLAAIPGYHSRIGKLGGKAKAAKYTKTIKVRKWR